MQHIGWLQGYCKFHIFNSLIGTTVIGVIEMSVFIPVHTHLVWHQRVKCHHLVFTVTDNLCVGIAPQKQMGHECLSEHERTHFRIRLIMEQSVKRMVDGFFLAAVIVIFVKMQRQACHCFCKDTDTGIHCRHLHGRTLGYCLAGSCAAHIKGVGTARRSVFGLISRLKHSRKNTHIKSRSFLNK